MQKHSGEYPIIGVNTFLSKDGSKTIIPAEVIRSTTEEKDRQIRNVRAFQQRNSERSAEALRMVKRVSVANGNIFEALMEASKVCSLGQLSAALYQVGGQYRRSM
jgi:methylmalonyl-CoA mutase